MSWPWSTPITSQLGKKNDSCPATFSFQRRIHLRVLCLHRVWHDSPQQTGRNAPLWRLLLHDLSAGSDRGWVGDVVFTPLRVFFLTSRAKRGSPTFTMSPRPTSIPRHQKCWYVYILSSLSGTLYVGLTDDMRHRTGQHKHGLFDSFTKKYMVNRLVYYEVFRGPTKASMREQQIKKYRREKKIALFIPTNPHWKDLTKETYRILAVL